MDQITVLLVESDPARRARLIRAILPEDGITLIDWQDYLLADFLAITPPHFDVLLLDADCPPAMDVRVWAQVHVLFPEAHIVALTDGLNDRILEAVLAAGITGLYQPDCEPATLALAIRRAAQGIISADRALIKHAKKVLLAPPTETQIRYGGLTIDLQSREVTRWGRHIHLTPLEFNLLAHLAQQHGQPVCLSKLLKSVWLAPPDQGGTLAQVYNCIKRIRQKIEPDIKHPRYLLSERGRGYWLHDPILPRNAKSSDVSHTGMPQPCTDDLPTELIDN